MERQDQKLIETLESQIPESLEEPQEKSCVTPSYRAPQVFLVGNAKRLVAGHPYGNYYDYYWYYYYW
jgi:hypothetical protein